MDRASTQGAPALPLALPLTLSIRCRPAPGARAGRHRVVIEPDWTVSTPHDERLERIAAAMGGGVSCLPELRAVLPGFAEWWRRARRDSGPHVVSPDHGRSWHSRDGAHPCCPAAGFTDPREAAAHSREAGHVAAATGVDRRMLAGLVSSLGSGQDPAIPGGAAADLRAATWSCGLGPERAAALELDLARAGIRLDGGAGDGGGQVGVAAVELLLAVAQTGADPAWIAASAAGRGTGEPADPRLLAWLAWTCTDLDRELPAARAAWLATGARRADITALTVAGYLASTALEVAAAWRISTSGAAQWLAHWVGLGYRPTAAQLIGLRDVGLGYPPPPPAPAAVARVRELIAAATPDATALALELLHRGTARDTAAALRRGPGRRQARPTRRADEEEVGHRPA